MKITHRERGERSSQQYAVITIRVLVVTPIVFLALFVAIVVVAVYETIATVADMVDSRHLRRVDEAARQAVASKI